MGEGGKAIGPYGTLVDDGKRLGLSESALDVAFSIVSSKRGGGPGEGWQKIGPDREAGGFMLRYFLELFPTSKKVSKIGSKGCPKGSQKSTKIDRKRVQEGSRKGTSKGYPLQDQEK